MPHVTLSNGVELAFREQGEGVPAVLLHAWGETHRVFDPVVPLLAETMRVITPDLRGVGDSAKPRSGYSLADMASDVVDLIDALGIGACWLIGTSSGGYLAQQVAVRHPQRTLGLVLIGAPCRLPSPPADFGAFLSRLQDPVTREDVAALLESIPLHNPVPPTYRQDQVDAALTIPRHVWQESFDGLVQATAPVDLGPITTPTLILWGAEDDLLPRAQLDELRVRIEGSRVVSYEGTGHLVLCEKPGPVARDIIAFIAATTP